MSFALDQLRRGYAEEDSVRSKLLDGLTPLVKAERPMLWGALWIGLATAVDRLIRNGETDLLRYVVDELERTERDYWQEESPHVYPKASTNSTRKRRGKAPYQKLKRHTGSLDGSGLLAYGQGRVGRKGRAYTAWFRVKPPTRLPAQEADEWHPREVVVSRDERRVLERLWLGMSQREIGGQTGLTRYCIQQIVGALRERMRRLEAQDPQHRRNAHARSQTHGPGHAGDGKRRNRQRRRQPP